MGRMKEYYHEVLMQFESEAEEQEFCEWIDRNLRTGEDQDYINWLHEKEIELQDKEFLEALENDRLIAEQMAEAESYKKRGA